MTEFQMQKQIEPNEWTRSGTYMRGNLCGKALPFYTNEEMDYQ